MADNMCAANMAMACPEHHLVWHHGDAENAGVLFEHFSAPKKCVFFVLKIVQKGQLWDVRDVGFVLCISHIP